MKGIFHYPSKAPSQIWRFLHDSKALSLLKLYDLHLTYYFDINDLIENPMPVNKNAQLRYRILDRCLKDWSRYYTIFDLQKAVNETFVDMYGKSVSIYTIRKDIEDMKERMGFDAPIKIIRCTDNT